MSVVMMAKINFVWNSTRMGKIFATLRDIIVFTSTCPNKNYVHLPSIYTFGSSTFCNDANLSATLMARWRIVCKKDRRYLLNTISGLVTRAITHFLRATFSVFPRPRYFSPFFQWFNAYFMILSPFRILLGELLESLWRFRHLHILINFLHLSPATRSTRYRSILYRFIIFLCKTYQNER